ncbi:MAG: hypothetical protein AABM33_05905 [Pseudomonadota bacterium]
MAVTVQQVCDRARAFLKDAAKDRYPDDITDPTQPSLRQFVNDGVQALFANRPDLFLGSYSALPADGALALATAVPVPDFIIPSMVDWVVARAESLDDEYTVDQRAQAFMVISGMNRGERR